MTLDDSGWSQRSTPLGRGVDSLGRQAIRETSGAGPLFAAGPSLVHKDKVIFATDVPDIKEAHFSE